MTKGIIIGAAGYVGMKICESLLAAVVDAASTVLGAASEFYVYDGQQERGIEAEEDCQCHQIGFEIPSEPQSELEDDEDIEESLNETVLKVAANKIGFR